MKAETGTDIEKAASLLKGGKLVAIPTETVYGLAGNAYDTDAVLEIFRVKNRPQFNPLIVHTHSLEKAKEFVISFPEKALILAKVFWPGPLTLLVPKNPEKIHDLVTSGNDRVAVRIPDHPVAIQLLQKLDFPICAPSANPFGYISPTSALHVKQQLGEKIPYILDGGLCEVGIESTIVGFEAGNTVIYRKGGLPVEDIEEELGEEVLFNSDRENPAAPGMLLSHYAPNSKLILENREELPVRNDNPKSGALVFSTTLPGILSENQRVLSASGNLNEAAKNLFGFLRELDNLGLDEILAEYVPDTGLGKAINDRLRRAAAE